VEDIPSASCIGSWLANILEQLHSTGKLSKTVIDLLDSHGLKALSRLASRDISYSEFLELAKLESKYRMPIHIFKQRTPLIQLEGMEAHKVEASHYHVASHQRQAKEGMMRTNYVLIDFENVQPENLAVLNHEHFKVIVFVGANQAKVPFEVASALQSLGNRAEYVKISSSGSNALDFHIAYYLGQLAVKDPNACFHIISKDTGFDPLTDYMRTKGVSVIRKTMIEDIPFLKSPHPLTSPPPLQPPATPKAPQPPASIKVEPQRPVPPPKIAPPPPKMPPPQTKKANPRLLAILQNLRLLKVGKPRKVKTLTSHIKTMFPKTITEAEIIGIIAEMARLKHITITDNKVTYQL
jgi:hypothetical protein